MVPGRGWHAWLTNSLEGTFLGGCVLFGQDRRQGGGGGRLNRYQAGLIRRTGDGRCLSALFAATSRPKLIAQSARVWRLGKRLSPRLVSLYSTRGGTVG